MSYLTTLDAMNEAASYGCRPTCKHCHEETTTAEAVISEMVDDVFCSESCKDAYETAFTDYMNAETARAAREFRNRTPSQARRVSEWNTFADAMNSGNPITGRQARQMHDGGTAQ